MLDKSDITKQTPEKSLVEPKKRTGGRNAHGEITIWHRGGGHKKQYRSIDFRREKKGIPARVAAIEYDPNRSARLALLSSAGTPVGSCARYSVNATCAPPAKSIARGASTTIHKKPIRTTARSEAIAIRV